MNENSNNVHNENTMGSTTPPPVNGQVPPYTGVQTPPPTYQMPPQQPYSPPPTSVNGRVRGPGFGSAKKEKWPAVVIAFTLGWLGIHKYYLGYKSEGTAMLLIALIGGICLFGLGFAVTYVISVIEAVKYASLTEEDFEATYTRGYKGWF